MFNEEDYIEENKNFGLPVPALQKPHLYWAWFVDFLIGLLIVLWEIRSMFESRSLFPIILPENYVDTGFFGTGLPFRCFHLSLIILGISLWIGALGLYFGIHYDNETIIHIYTCINFVLVIILTIITIAVPILCPLYQSQWILFIVFFLCLKEGSLTRVRAYQNALYDSRKPKLAYEKKTTIQIKKED